MPQCFCVSNTACVGICGCTQADDLIHVKKNSWFRDSIVSEFPESRDSISFIFIATVLSSVPDV